MKKLFALLLLLASFAASAATNNYNIGDQTNITGGGFTNTTLSGTTTLPGLNASSLVTTSSGRVLSSYAGTSCTNQAIYSLSVAAVASCTSTFAGGAHTGMTALGLRSTGAGAFDLTIANTEDLTAGRTLTLKLNDAARTVNLAGNLTLGGAFVTSGASSLTLTTTGTTNVTLPTTGTLYALGGALGTPSSVTLTNGTGLPISAGLTGAGTGVLTALGLNVGSAGAFVTNGGALGTPTSGTLTNTTGLPVSTGISGLGTGIAAALAVNIGAAGAPVLFNGAGGTPTSLTLTNATGLPISAGISGLGTGVATALAVNVGSAGAPVVNGGALGTPSSGTLSNVTGLPVGTGISGLGTGVATFLATPSSANLAAAVTDEAGTGALAFSSTGSWTPSPSSLTVVGTPTYTGTYQREGNLYHVVLTVVSTTTTASTAGSTIFTGLPATPASPTTCAAVNRSTVASYGAGLLETNGTLYAPTWPAVANVVVTCTYRV